MENQGVKFEFKGKVYQYSTSGEMGGWTFVNLPKELSLEIRTNLKCLEEGWGRLKVTANTGHTQWQTAIWFDTKQDTYMLPLKAVIRKKENINWDDEIEVTITV